MMIGGGRAAILAGYKVSIWARSGAQSCSGLRAGALWMSAAALHHFESLPIVGRLRQSSVPLINARPLLRH